MKRSSPSALRNRDPILAVLRTCLPARGDVLEIAGGSGEHVVHFAAALPHLTFRPSDGDAAAVASIEARRAEAELENIRSAVILNVEDEIWPVASADAIVCINMIHIAPWSACEGLIAGAARVLPPGGVLFLYGPYFKGNVATAPSNEAFDADLRARNPAWGLRHLEDVLSLARDFGLAHAGTHTLPANNIAVVIRRETPDR